MPAISKNHLAKAGRKSCKLLQQEMASLKLLILLISLGLGCLQIASSTVCNCTEQLQAVKNELQVEMQTSISAVRKDVEALRNATKLLLGRYMLPHDIQSAGEQCTTTDQFDQMLGSIQQGIVNSSTDGFRQFNLTIQQLQNDLQNQVAQVQEKISVAGTFQNPANSCQQIAEVSPGSLPGYFWVASGASSPDFVYCTPNTHCCSSANIQGWMRVANLDMTDPSQGCPSGFKLTTSPKRGCFRTRTPGCTPITFGTHGITYSKVCGRVKGYLYSTPDAFWPYYNHRGITLDGAYVDGVSITRGRTPRQHIWTFAATAGTNADQYSCPCSRNGVTNSGVVPPFINNEYFCEGGTTTEPMWDGGDCPSTSSCCSFNKPPWFCKQFSQPSSSDIEVRVCADEPASTNEDIQIEVVEIYIH